MSRNGIDGGNGLDATACKTTGLKLHGIGIYYGFTKQGAIAWDPIRDSEEIIIDDSCPDTYVTDEHVIMSQPRHLLHMALELREYKRFLREYQENPILGRIIHQTYETIESRGTFTSIEIYWFNTFLMGD